MQRFRGEFRDSKMIPGVCEACPMLENQVLVSFRTFQKCFFLFIVLLLQQFLNKITINCTSIKDHSLSLT
jgi:hypothetical protein